MSETNDLLRCPFCGGNNIKGYTVSTSTYTVECQNCFGSCGIHNTPERAVAAWNRRHTDAAPPERPTTPLSQIDEIKLRKALERAWRLLDRGASREQAIGVIADALGTNEVPDAGVGEALDWPSDDVIAEVLERAELGRELIAWAGDIQNVSYWNGVRVKRVCGICNATLAGKGYKHPENDCLHLRARALRDNA